MELSIAPMMDWTTRHQRYLARQLAPRTVLYTEMVVDSTVVHNEHKGLERWYGFDDVEHPVVLQLGGNNVEAMTRSAVLGEQWGYDEINLNVGCPSKLVSKNEFGARLMLKPDLVREMVTSIQRQVSVPVTVKCRLGVDDFDSYEFAKDFVSRIPECEHFIIHARKCLLNGLSTHGNRTVPPLMYERVYDLCRDFPDKKFSLNGGLTCVDQIGAIADEHPELHGFMVGRAAYNNPCLLPALERRIYGETLGESLTRRDVIERYVPYCQRMQEEGHDTLELLKPLAYLFHGLPETKRYRLIVNQSGKGKRDRTDDIQSIVDAAMEAVSPENLDAPILSREGAEFGSENASPIDSGAAASLEAAVMEKAVHIPECC